MTDLVIPTAITEIKENAFIGCASLKSVEIPASVTSIGESAFQGCKDLTEIISRNTTPPTLGTDCFKNIPNTTCTLKVPTESLDKYKATNVWKDFQNIKGI